jgi:hypothetical protein
MLRVSVWLISALLVWRGKSFEAATVAQAMIFLATLSVG